MDCLSQVRARGPRKKIIATYGLRPSIVCLIVLGLQEHTIRVTPDVPFISFLSCTTNLPLLKNSREEDEGDCAPGGVPHDEAHDQEQLGADHRKVEEEDRAQHGRGGADDEAD